VLDVLAVDLDVVLVGSTRVACRRRRTRTSRTRATTSGGCCNAAGLTSRLYEPSEQFDLLKEGTDAACWTTAGSGDFRRADFAGSAERLEGIACDLPPRWLAFVGKDADRGVFNERVEFGVQARSLGPTRLFILPSTSPANAAVPWDERVRWFEALAAVVADRED
jgi:double-stranded uracil-DNA glycosylase